MVCGRGSRVADNPPLLHLCLFHAFCLYVLKVCVQFTSRFPAYKLEFQFVNRTEMK